MPVTAIMGAQWGDEGKGKLVDYLAAEADLVIRYQGGANAGHTVVTDRGQFKLRLVPSGILRPATQCLLAPGVAVDPELLLQELAELAGRGVATDNLLIAERATLVMPWHRQLDELEERARGEHALGTTRRGIGPAFADRTARRALQVGDLLDRAWFGEQVRRATAEANRVLVGAYGARPVDGEAVIAAYAAYGDALHERIVDSLAVVRGALASAKSIILEGQAGVQRDLLWGTYPYCTSSSPLAGAALASAAIPPAALTRVIGAAKAYGTCVGSGPFPAEDTGELSARLRADGNEYGVVTGRPRRCGWLDTVATRYAVEVAGITELALTKLDVLDGLAELQLCTGYRIDGRVVTTVPPTRLLERVEPLYEALPGWQRPTTAARRFADLPRAAQAYVARIEQLTGVPVSMISVGQHRDATITR